MESEWDRPSFCGGRPNRATRSGRGLLFCALGFVLAEERLEGIGAGEIVEQVLAFFGVQGGSEEFFSLLTELLQPNFIFRAELFFEFFAKALGQRRALARSGDGDLQRAAPCHGGIVEVAKLGNVDDVAEYAAPLRFGVDLLVQFGRESGGDDEEHSIEIARLIGTREPFDLAGGGP